MTISTPRIGEWMQTFTGKQFYPMDPRVEDIDHRDIAHSLAYLCRYNGHVTRFFSVAEHCVFISQVVSPENALWGLLHDATEAYVGDMVRPLKRSMPEYVAAENVIMALVAEKFGLENKMPPEVKEADTRILVNEKAGFLAESGHLWHIDELEPLDITLEGWAPAEAEERYLDRLAELLAARR